MAAVVTSLYTLCLHGELLGRLAASRPPYDFPSVGASVFAGEDAPPNWTSLLAPMFASLESREERSLPSICRLILEGLCLHHVNASHSTKGVLLAAAWPSLLYDLVFRLKQALGIRDLHLVGFGGQPATAVDIFLRQAGLRVLTMDATDMDDDLELVLESGFTCTRRHLEAIGLGEPLASPDGPQPSGVHLKEGWSWDRHPNHRHPLRREPSVSGEAAASRFLGRAAPRPD